MCRRTRYHETGHSAYVFAIGGNADEGENLDDSAFGQVDHGEVEVRELVPARFGDKSGHKWRWSDQIQ